MGGVGHGRRGGGVGRRRAWPALVGGGSESGLRAWPPPASDPLEPGWLRRAWPPPAPANGSGARASAAEAGERGEGGAGEEE